MEDSFTARGDTIAYRVCGDVTYRYAREGGVYDGSGNSSNTESCTYLCNSKSVPICLSGHSCLVFYLGDRILDDPIEYAHPVHGPYGEHCEVFEVIYHTIVRDFFEKQCTESKKKLGRLYEVPVLWKCTKHFLLGLLYESIYRSFQRKGNFARLGGIAIMKSICNHNNFEKEIHYVLV